MNDISAGVPIDPDHLADARGQEAFGDQTVVAFIEIPMGSRNKYEYDKELRAFKLDRVLFSSVHYPTDYGFIRDTLWEDGDPLDILLLVYEPTFPGCLVNARPIGGLDMSDEHGSDFKVLAVPCNDPRFSDIQSLGDLSKHLLKEISNFFETYKILEEKPTKILGWYDADESHARIAHSRELFRQHAATS
ncbi:MAG: inorganic diphosphatase [Thermomicrobiales bacterium]